MTIIVIETVKEKRMEQKQNYFMDDSLEDAILATAFSISIRQAGMVRDLVDRGYGKNRSDIVRQAIEFYYHSKDNAQA
jgi:hypothetical protein